MEIYNIETGNFKCDGGAMFSVVPKLLWSRKYPSDEDNLCNCAMRSMLVVDGERKILIDNGSGDKQDVEFFKHHHLNGNATLLSSLSNIGFQPTDITDVVFTHLHFDHCGGAVKNNEKGEGFDLVFPNATHWVSKTQWENFNNPNIREADAYFQENIVPIKEVGQLKLVDREGELFPNFEIRFVNGHTPGLMVAIIKNENDTIVFAGDFIPTTANVPVKWLASYDLNPKESLHEKEAFLKEAVENNYILFFQHDILHECCSLVQTPRGVKVDKCFSLTEIK
ncbi:MBL fold metallo-hydrolase [Labilibaculum antarcticum]|uniref:MBL fold metallo-hydrolase n=1 Tax=Labilibaculum antarcticum TaxID=1717717 RepID=A0A1Y1CHI6_9BACT|nr:MBL fold metallo-hydrolase [Labilibaculum antarcticum]BAX79804.1 MBL fold metallo-hydrolase [Labilibaculum antarcticum]